MFVFFTESDLYFLCLLGGWWCVGGFGDITGTVAIEMQNNSYVHALDTGLFTLGVPHKGKTRDCNHSHYSTGQNPPIITFFTFQVDVKTPCEL